MTTHATDPSYAQLPVIDLSAADRGPEERALFHARLHSAAHDVGFFQLTGHGVTRAETDALTSISTRCSSRTTVATTSSVA